MDTIKTSPDNVFSKWLISTDIVVHPGLVADIDFVAIDQLGLEVDKNEPTLRNGPFSVLSSGKISKGHYRFKIKYFENPEMQQWIDRKGTDYYLWKAYKEFSNVWTSKIDPDAEAIYHGIMHVHSKDHSAIPYEINPDELFSKLKKLFRFGAVIDHGFTPYMDRDALIALKAAAENATDQNFIGFTGYEHGAGTNGTIFYFRDEVFFFERHLDLHVPCLKLALENIVGTDNVLIITHPQQNAIDPETGINKSWLYPEIEGFEFWSMWNAKIQFEIDPSEYKTFFYENTFHEGIKLGREFFVTGDSDSHHATFNNSWVPTTGKDFLHQAHAYTFVKSPALTKDDLWNSFKAKKTYASTLGMFMHFEIAGNVLEYEVAHGPGLIESNYDFNSTLKIYAYDGIEVNVLKSIDYQRQATGSYDISPYPSGVVFWLQGRVGPYDAYVSTPARKE